PNIVITPKPLQTASNVEYKRPPSPYISTSFKEKEPKRKIHPNHQEWKILLRRSSLHKKPTQQNNYLSAPNLSKKSSELVSQISPQSQQEKISLANANKKTNQQLTLIPNQKEKATETELILLAKIKNLEKQLAQIKTENANLKSENQHLKSLIQKEAEITQAQIIQLPSTKLNK
ncbi:6835_t:CDS:2, partial [Ambispora gerdemannii]